MTHRTPVLFQNSSTGSITSGIPEALVTRGGERYRFAPDGHLIYMHGAGPMQNFWQIDLKTGDKRQLTKLLNVETMVSFDIDPEGKTIIFDRERPNSDVVLIDLEE